MLFLLPVGGSQILKGLLVFGFSEADTQATCLNVKK